MKSAAALFVCATFLRAAFVSERGDPHHEPGDFTFPSLAQDENMTGNSTLGSVVSGGGNGVREEMGSGCIN